MLHMIFIQLFGFFFLSLSMVLYLVQQQEKVNFTHKHILDAVLFPSFMENAYYITYKMLDLIFGLF